MTSDEGRRPPRGTWFVVPTAFAEDGSFDPEGQRQVVDAAIRWGVDGLTVMGVMSEVAALTAAERRGALGTVFDAVDRRVPVAVGCSAANATVAASLAQEARDLGAVAAMVSAPPLMRNIDALPDFYAQVAERGGLPLVIQDEPAATGVAIPVSILLKALAAAAARTVKLEDPPTPPKIERLLAADPGLQVFGGLGGVSALGELRRGACGTMTGFAFPEILAALRRAVEGADLDAAGRLFDRYLPLIQFEAQPLIGLAIRKEVLRRRGALRTAVTRGPFRTVDAVTSHELDELFERHGIEPGPEPLPVAVTS